jgi:hypothetical protein
MSQIAVYSYVILNSDNHRDVAGRRMATADAIRRVNGHLNLSSKMTVDESDVDVEGFYPRLPDA